MADFSGVLAGLSVSAGVAAIIGAGALMAAPGFARWLTNKVATFFSGDDLEEDDDVLDHGDQVDDWDGVYQCQGCGYEMDADDAQTALDNDYCPKCGE